MFVFVLLEYDIYEYIFKYNISIIFKLLYIIIIIIIIIIMEIIKYLPDDLKHHIYKQYLWFDVEKKTKCDKVLYWFEHDEEAQEFKLDIEIIYLMEELLLCKTSMKYLCDCDESIKHCYNNHYINNIKQFTQENMFTSFLHAIILHKHH